MCVLQFCDNCHGGNGSASGGMSCTNAELICRELPEDGPEVARIYRAPASNTCHTIGTYTLLL